jgi:hypothetical protein
MSKTNDTSKLDRAKVENRVLADTELDAVSGGTAFDTILEVWDSVRVSPPRPTDNTRWGDIVLK